MNSTINATNLGFESVKAKIGMKLVNAKDVPENTPFVPYLDLAIYFFIDLTGEYPAPEGSYPRAVINNALIEQFDVTAEDLFELAKENMPTLFPAEIQSIGLTLSAMMGVSVSELPTEDIPLTVCTNSAKTAGAVTIVYPNVLSDFGNQSGKSFYILPSSIHETLFLPASAGVKPSALRQMVQDVNRTVLNPEEYLSDNVYYYDIDTNQLSIVKGGE